MARKKATQTLPVAEERYPDLTAALALLEDRLTEDVTADRHQLLTKWHDQLAKLQHEISRLQKLEKFHTNLTRKSAPHD